MAEALRPRLKELGLEWVNFQVLRRTHSSLLDDLGVDPRVRAEQMGHEVDVNQNGYTKASLDRRNCPGVRKWLVWDDRRWAVDERGTTRRLAKQTMLAYLAEATDADGTKCRLRIRPWTTERIVKA